MKKQFRLSCLELVVGAMDDSVGLDQKYLYLLCRSLAHSFFAKICCHAFLVKRKEKTYNIQEVVCTISKALLAK